MPVSSAEQTNARSRTHLAYIPGLDGLRAVAVAGVLLYHADLPWFRGGYLGVDVFFVLSGFLITSLLLVEWHKDGRIDLKAFWLRRARRLLPALFLMVIAGLTFAVLFLPEEVASLRNDAIAAATYVTNWYLVVTQRSYFETVGRPSLFQHLWSLAVEEQFYLLWPLLFIFLMKFARRLAMLFVLLGAASSVVFMWTTFDPDADPSRLYYGTDSRAAALLIGAGLALTLARGKEVLQGSRSLRMSLDLMGIGALALLGWCFLTLDETQAQVYQGGMLALELTTAVLILSLAHPHARLMPWLLGGRVMQWIGQRSYGLYLWHWPVFMVTRPQLDVPFAGVSLLFLRFGITVVLAELSYRFVEAPVRRGALDRSFKVLRLWKTKGIPAPTLRSAAVLTALLGFAILVGVPVVEARPPALQDYLATQEISTLKPPDVGAVDADQPPPQSVLPGDSPQPAGPFEGAPKAALSSKSVDGTSSVNAGVPDVPLRLSAETVKVPAQSVSSKPPDAPSIEPVPTQTPMATKPAGDAPITFPTRPAATQAAQATNIASLGRITAIGDSVMIGAAHNLKQLGDVDIDAQVGRQVSAAIKVLRSYHDSGRLGPVVVLHIGNNGTFSARQFDDIMKVLSDEKHVVFVNLKVPRGWERPNNKVIVEGVARYPNAVLVDWHAGSIDRPQLFWKDGIHLRPEGAKVYANLIGDALNALADK